MRFDFTCPRCQRETAFVVTPVGVELFRQLTPQERAELWRREAPISIQEALNDFEAQGILSSFQRAIEGIQPQSRPNNTYKFLFTVLSRMAKIMVPRHVLDHMIAEFSGYIETWGANGIIAVTANGNLKGFVAANVVASMEPPSTVGPKLDTSREWMRTRFGYVTSPILFDEFRRRSLGAWDTVTGR